MSITNIKSFIPGALFGIASIVLYSISFSSIKASGGGLVGQSISWIAGLVLSIGILLIARRIASTVGKTEEERKTNTDGVTWAVLLMGCTALPIISVAVALYLSGGFRYAHVFFGV